MVNSSTPITQTYGLTGTNIQSNRSSSTADIISSFKEILTLMTATSSMSSGPQQMGSGMGDLMAPLMLLLLEKLVEQSLDAEPSSASAEQSSSGTVTNSSSLITSQDSRVVPSGRPVVGGRLTQEYHGGHHGLDIGIPVGTPITATMDGRIVHAGWNNQGYGNLVIVENGDYKTYYAHLSSIPVSVGDTVNAGATIGLSGNTGNSTGPHLHYEIRRNGVTIDPTSATLGTG
ncbi:MAG: M23 family metallopeptidase [Anaerolineales bacterium]